MTFVATGAAAANEAIVDVVVEVAQCADADDDDVAMDDDKVGSANLVGNA